MWFPGVHSNIGGGCDDQQLANITLAWMAAQLLPFIDIDTDYILEQDDENDEYYRDRGMRVRPWSFGSCHAFFMLDAMACMTYVALIGSVIDLAWR